jgi:hypothetical protein
MYFLSENPCVFSMLAALRSFGAQLQSLEKSRILAVNMRRKGDAYSSNT